MSDHPATLRDSLLDRLRADPDGLAFDDGSHRLSYRELAETAAGQAARLAELGVGARDRVALAMPAGIPFAQAFWALQLLGAAPCAFNPHVPAGALERRIAPVKPRLVVREGLLDGAAPARKLPPDPGITPDDVAFLQPTSGTAGEPRAAMLTHRNVTAYVHRDDRAFGAPDDVLVAWVPPWHDLGLVRFVIGAVGYAAPCHLVEPAVRTIPQWLATVSRVRGTLTGAPDFAYRLATRLVDPGSVDLSSLRFATNGGEPVRASTIEEFESRFGLSAAVVPGYGLAEATLGVTSHRVGEPIVVDARGNVSCGVPRGGLELRAGAGPEAPEEILVRGETVFAGYFDAPEATAETLRDGWLHTGDTGYRDGDGRLFVLGRQKAMIKRGGAVVAPRELEEVAQAVDGVRLAAAVGLPDAVGVSEMAVVVVEHGRAGSDAAASVAAAVSGGITAALGFGPGRVAVVPPRTIPLTANGKVRHERLRELLLEGAIAPTAAADRAGTR